MKLPATQLLLVPMPVISTPTWLLPEMTLPAPETLPPMVLSAELLMVIPLPKLASAAVPAALVPMKLPLIRLPPLLAPAAWKMAWISPGLSARLYAASSSMRPLTKPRPSASPIVTGAFGSGILAEEGLTADRCAIDVNRVQTAGASHRQVIPLVQSGRERGLDEKLRTQACAV